MRNRYAGKCYRCGKTVDVGKGHFERYNGGWLTIHAECVLLQRKEKMKQGGKRNAISTVQG